MLTVRRVEIQSPDAAAYECLNGDKVVGKLTAFAHPDGSWVIRPIEANEVEASRSLLAIFERDALNNRVRTIYLECHDAAEKARYFPTGYNEMPSGGNTLVKKMPIY